MVHSRSHFRVNCSIVTTVWIVGPRCIVHNSILMHSVLVSCNAAPPLYSSDSRTNII
ncbi:hypothetical protein C8Q78DRAFT_1049376, partial [Trametes maxima]